MPRKRVRLTEEEAAQIERGEFGELIHARDDQGRPICGANCAKGPCRIRRPYIYMNGRCYKHGGPNSARVGWGNEGRVSKYDAIVNEQQGGLLNILSSSEMEWKSSLDEIHMMETRLVDISENLNEKLDEKAVTQLSSIVNSGEMDINNAFMTGDPQIVRKSVDSLLQKIRGVLGDESRSARNWEEFIKLTKDKAALIEKEHRMQKDSSAMMTAEQSYALITRVVTTFRRHALPESTRMINYEVRQKAMGEYELAQDELIWIIRQQNAHVLRKLAEELNGALPLPDSSGPRQTRVTISEPTDFSAPSAPEVPDLSTLQSDQIEPT